MNNLKIAFRNLLKSKTVTLINLFGLTLGMVVTVLLLSYVRQEKDTDTFIKDYEDIYLFTQDKEHTAAYMSRLMVALLRERFLDIPITYAANDWAGQIFLADNTGNTYKVNHLLNTDSTFFSVFQFDAVAGNPQRALDVTSQIVLKESLAKKIFGDQNPIGKTLHLSTSYYNSEPLEVSAVLKDFPENSAWQFDAAVSVYLNDKKISWYADNANRWGAKNYTAFCRLPKNVDVDNFQEQLEAIAQSSEVTENNNNDINLMIQPYSQRYLHTQESARYAVLLKIGDTRMLKVMELIAMLILSMACINYINLVSAQRRKRNKSVAVIKMLGSQTWGVVRIFLAEAELLLLAVLGLSTFLIPFALDLFNRLMETDYTTAIFLLPQNIRLMGIILLVTLLITGLLPGLIFSRYQALRLMKPTVKKERRGFFRNMLPVMQFSIAIALIACLFVIKKQNDMMLTQNTGLEKEHIIYAATNNDLKKQSQALVNDLKTVSGVSDITFADAEFVKSTQNWGVNATINGEEKIIGFAKIGVSANFFDFFGIKMVQGHTFTKTKANYDEVIFNQSAMHEFGIADSEKTRILGNGQIIGVVQDFNLKSAHYPIAPVGFLNDGETSNYIYLKTNAQSLEQMKKVIAEVEQRWNRLSPNIPFEYHFLDEEWGNLYKKEARFQKLLTHAGWISIFIACLGLFGLSMFVAEQRTKEIGIRKVNGATIKEILTLLNTGFIKWIVIAFVIATPIAYYAMSRWLENFAYKTALSWWIFALAGLAALVVALLTVSWQSWRAASRNPVEALRYE